MGESQPARTATIVRQRRSKSVICPTTEADFDQSRHTAALKWYLLHRRKQVEMISDERPRFVGWYLSPVNAEIE